METDLLFFFLPEPPSSDSKEIVLHGGMANPPTKTLWN